MTSCLIILNYNGRPHLDDCVSSAVAAASLARDPCSVLFVDNRSTEKDAQYVRERFPSVEIYEAPNNDFLFSLNDVVNKRTEEVVIILNNDMRFDAHFVDPLLSPFRNLDVFAVSSKILDWNGEPCLYTGRTVGYYKNAWFYRRWILSADDTSLSLFALGCSSAYRRRMFIELGGFDHLFRPGYFEDHDLSFRAWKRGWMVVYEPRSVVYHKINASFRKAYGRTGIQRLIARNEILFMVKNCGSNLFCLLYVLLLPYRALKNLLFGRTHLTMGFLDALPRIPGALRRRALAGRGSTAESVFLPRIERGFFTCDNVLS